MQNNRSNSIFSISSSGIAEQRTRSRRPTHTNIDYERNLSPSRSRSSSRTSLPDPTNISRTNNLTRTRHISTSVHFSDDYETTIETRESIIHTFKKNVTRLEQNLYKMNYNLSNFNGIVSELKDANYIECKTQRSDDNSLQLINYSEKLARMNDIVNEFNSIERGLFAIPLFEP